MLWSLLLALALGFAWWFPSMRLNPDWMDAWTIWNASFFGVPDLDAVLRPMRDLPWFLWPTWPLALLALWQWRRWISAPHIWIPLAFVLGVMLMLPVTTEHSEAEYVQLAVPLAVLAAFALPTMRRGVVNTLDWFALMCRLDRPALRDSQADIDQHRPPDRRFRTSHRLGRGRRRAFRHADVGGARALARARAPDRALAGFDALRGRHHHDLGAAGAALDAGA